MESAGGGSYVCTTVNVRLLLTNAAKKCLLSGLYFPTKTKFFQVLQHLEENCVADIDNRLNVRLLLANAAKKVF